MTAKDRSELDWLAFQYIAGELPADEMTRFEERLANDQQACEAVAEAVELAEVTALVVDRPVDLVTTKTVRVARIDWARSLAWMGCGAAACLVLVALVQQLGWNQWTGGQGLASSRSVHGESPELALAWAMARTNASTAAATNDDTLDSDAAAADETNTNEKHADEKHADEDDISAPSWMLAGVAGLGIGVEDLE